MQSVCNGKLKGRQGQVLKSFACNIKEFELYLKYLEVFFFFFKQDNWYFSDLKYNKIT